MKHRGDSFVLLGLCVVISACAAATAPDKSDPPGEQATPGMMGDPAPAPLQLDPVTATTPEDTAVSIDLAPAAAAGVSFEIVTPPAHGTLGALAGHVVTYTPAPNYNGPDALRFAAVRGTERAEANATITVTAVQDVLVAIDDAVTVAEGGTAQGSVVSNDIDPDGLGQVSVTQMPAHGMLLLNSDGTYTYAHDGSPTPTSDAFGYLFSDGTTSVSATVTVTITPVNDPPVAAGEAIVVAEGGTVSGSAPGLLLNDTDEEGATLTVVGLGSGPAHGTAQLMADGSASYTHDGSETTSDSFTYLVTDGVNQVSATVLITITPVNDPPHALADAFTVAEGGTATATALNGVRANDSDVEGDPLSVSVDTAPQFGALTLNSDGSYSYTHNGSSAPTSDSFVYSLTDGTSSVTGLVTITITPVDDPPTALAHSFTVAEGGSATQAALDSGHTSLLYGANDEETPGTLSIATSPTTSPQHGTLTLQSNGGFTYTHDGGETVSDSFGFRTLDGTGQFVDRTVTITVTPVNDPPLTSVVVSSPTANSAGVVPFRLTISDIDAQVGQQSTASCEWTTDTANLNNATWTATLGVTPASFSSTINGGQSAQVKVAVGQATSTSMALRCRATDQGGATGPYSVSNVFIFDNRGIVYVDLAAPVGGTGGTWATAYNNLNTALSAQVSPPSAGVEVWIKQGTYVPQPADGFTGRQVRFRLNSRVRLYGGFSGTETRKDQRDGMHESILSGEIGASGTTDNTYHVVQLQADAALDGVTVTRGNANGTSSDALGGGIIGQAATGNFYVSNVVLRDNSGTNGAAMAMNGTTVNSSIVAFLSNIVAYNNTTSGAAGGTLHSGGPGGTIFYGSNWLLFGNASASGRVLTLSATSGDLDHVTIANNTAAAVVNICQGSPKLRNSIIWGNVLGGGGTAPLAAGCNSGALNASFSDLQGSGGSGAWAPSGPVSNGGSNIDADPVFTIAGPLDPLDFQLGNGSPAINAGTNSAASMVLDYFDADLDSVWNEALPFDISGERRLVGVARDMGVYER